MKRVEVSDEVEVEGEEVERRVFVQSETHAALREIATRLLSLTSPPSDADIQSTMKEVQLLEGEVDRVTARVGVINAIKLCKHAKVQLQQLELFWAWHGIGCKLLYRAYW